MYKYKTQKYKLLFYITNPLFLVIFSNALAIFLFFITPNKVVLDFAKENKYISAKALLVYLLFIIFFLLGYLLTPVKLGILDKFNEKYEKIAFILIKKFALITFIFTLIGYTIWFREFILNFNNIMFSFLSYGAYSTRNILKEYMIPGITTFTQFGIISSIFYFLLFSISKNKKYLLPIIIIIILSTFRVLFFGERLAFLEIIIPIIFIYLRFHPEKTKRFLIIGLIIFTIVWSSELLRSYLSPIYFNEYSPIKFLIYRLNMYFVTTINNCFLIFDKSELFNNFLPLTLKFLYHSLGNSNISSYSNILTILDKYANPEYNNLSFFGELYFDWGYYGFIISFIVGSICKISYSLYRKFTLFGIIIYPIIIVFLLQSYRIFYLSSPRIIYPYFTIFIFFFSYNFKKEAYAKKVKQNEFDLY